MIPSAEASRRLVASIEQWVHRIRGWDQRAVLGFATDGLADDHALAWVPLPPNVQPHIVRDDPLSGLRLVADSMVLGAPPFNAIAEKAPAELLPLFAGAAFVFEAWVTDRPEDEVPTDRIPDTPGSQEVRVVVLADCAGRITELRRVRGSVPDWYQWERGDPVESRTTDLGVPQALRDIVAVMGSRMPRDAVDLAAVHAMAWP